MKILQVVSSPPFCWDAGGPPRSVWELSKSLVKQGHDVTICSTNLHSGEDKFPVNKKFEKEGVKIYRFKNLNNWFAWKFFSCSPRMYWFLKKNLIEFDIVHINELRTVQAVITYKLCKKYKVPYILQPRGSIQKKNKKIIKNMFDNIIGNNIIRDCKYIVISSMNEYKIAKDTIKKNGIKDNKIKIIPNGINMKDFERNIINQGFKKKYNIPDKSKVLLFLSRIHRRKGIDLLVKAFKLLTLENFDLKLIIAGPDEGYKKELIKLINDLKVENKVIITGGLYGIDKKSAYAHSDVFVLPSIDEQESFGNVVLEVSALSKPSVVTNVCGVSEYLRNIIKVNPDVESIKNGIKKALENTDMGHKVKKELYEKFSWNIISNKFISIYK